MMNVNGVEIVDSDTEWAVEDEGRILDMDNEEEARVYTIKYGGQLKSRQAFLSDWVSAS